MLCKSSLYSKGDFLACFDENSAIICRFRWDYNAKNICRSPKRGIIGCILTLYKREKRTTEFEAKYPDTPDMSIQQYLEYQRIDFIPSDVRFCLCAHYPCELFFKENSKHKPPVERLATMIVPPWNCTACLTTARPRPVPPFVRERPLSTR